MCTKSTEHASGTLFTCCVVYTTGRLLYVAIYRTYFNIIFYYVSKHILPCPRTKRLALNCFSIIYIATCMSILVFASKTFILRCPNIWHSSSLFCIIFKRFLKELQENSYPGRGIIIGRSKDGTKAVTAYFIMGRSENSRNRIFVEDGEGIRTQAFDPSKLVDPSLIIYAPVRVLGNKTIVTNGDQTDTIYEGMDRQLTFEQSLRSREFEPDAPNYTPRISGIMHIENGKYSYAMSILKSNNGNPDSCNRYTFAYENCVAGEGHFIHTYKCDGNPLPSFEGEPKLIAIPDDMETFTETLWNSLNKDNKVSLFVRYIDIATGKYETKIVNKNR